MIIFAIFRPVKSVHICTISDMKEDYETMSSKIAESRGGKNRALQLTRGMCRKGIEGEMGLHLCLSGACSFDWLRSTLELSRQRYHPQWRHFSDVNRCNSTCVSSQKSRRRFSYLERPSWLFTSNPTSYCWWNPFLAISNLK